MGTQLADLIKAGAKRLRRKDWKPGFIAEVEDDEHLVYHFGDHRQDTRVSVKDLSQVGWQAVADEK